jgi:broad specificity phosphatase PhoE
MVNKIEKWPEELLLTRHGESEANKRKAAAKLARAAGDTPTSAWAFEQERDMNTPLTHFGQLQAYNLGILLKQRYAGIPTHQGPFGSEPKLKSLDFIVLSPYVRTRQTTNWIVNGLGYTPELVIEERIREIEFGILDGLTREGVLLKYPDEAKRRERDGKYWFRPSGGESRPDVRDRVRLFLDTLNRDYVGTRTLVVCHSVVVLAFRSLLERWGETEYMQVDREDDVKNCGLTSYQREDKRRLKLVTYNEVAHLQAGQLPKTFHPVI